MFKFLESQLVINKNGFNFKESANSSDSQILSFLDFYEKSVYDYVKNQGDDFFFKYLQGKLPKNLLESAFSNYFGGKSDYNVFFLTQHPSFVGGILINFFLDCVEDKKNYIITYESPLSENWLNSGVDYMDVVNSFRILNKKVDLKKGVNISFIRIFKSSLINFRQFNLGSSKSLFKII